MNIIRELRLFNAISDNDGNVMYISEINRKYITTTDGAELDFKDIKPIPLTEDILLRCGFKSTFCSDPQQDDAEIQWAHPYNKTKNWTNIFNLYEHPLNRGFFDFHSYEDVINIGYLHQLQNLFFCVVGEELKIDEL